MTDMVNGDASSPCTSAHADADHKEDDGDTENVEPQEASLSARGCEHAPGRLAYSIDEFAAASSISRRKLYVDIAGRLKASAGPPTLIGARREAILRRCPPWRRTVRHGNPPRCLAVSGRQTVYINGSNPASILRPAARLAPTSIALPGKSSFSDSTTAASRRNPKPFCAQGLGRNHHPTQGEHDRLRRRPRQCCPGKVWPWLEPVRSVPTRRAPRFINATTA